MGINNKTTTAPSIQTLEELRSEIKAWMKTHPHEYANFVASMNGGNKGGLRFLGLITKGKIMNLEDEVAFQTAMSEPDFSFLLDIVAQSDMPKQFFEEESDRRNAVLAWLLYSRTYESVVESLETLIGDTRFSGYRWMLTRLAQFIISHSIQKGNRTQADWNEYRKYRKAVTSGSVVDMVNYDASMIENHKTTDNTQKRRNLMEILNDNADLADKIYDWVMVRHSGTDEAYLIIALKEMGYDIDNIQEFHEALTAQFPKVDFVGLRAVQKQIKQLETVVGMGKIAFKDRGKDRETIDLIKQTLSD